jgi:hypothetical protein
MKLIKIISAGLTDTERTALKVARLAGIAYAVSIDPVLDSDGTLILTIGSFNFQLKKVGDLSEKHHKPSLHLNLKETSTQYAPYEIHAWMESNSIETLYVTGPNESDSPGISENTRLLIDGLEMINRKMTYDVSDEDVLEFIEGLSLKEKSIIANMDETDLIIAQGFFEQFADEKKYGIGESRLLLTKVWNRLRKSHRLHLVPFKGTEEV